MKANTLKRIEPGYYEGIYNGYSVVVYKVATRGTGGGRVVGWNLKVDHKLVADWCVSKKEALSLVVRFH